MLVTVDFETYYSKDYSLKKLTTAEYVKDPQFYPHMMGIKIGDQPTEVVFDPEGISDKLAEIDWDDAVLVCQNTHFDGFILAEHFHTFPARYADTRSMSQALFVGERSHSLAAIADRLFDGWHKGSELADSIGVERLTGQLRSTIAAYCMNDVDLTYAAYKSMLAGMPESEMKLIDLTARMFCQPRLLLDVQRAAVSLCDIQERKKTVIKAAGVQRTILSSNPKFAEWIESNGMTVPMKLSPTNERETFALGKNDIGFQQLQQDHPEFKDVWAARLEVKSTIAEKRTERFIRHAEVNEGRMPVPLTYYGAHTGRFSGRDKINLQNLQRGSELRKCLIAPDGYQIVVVDSANIEARMLAWLAREEDVLKVFRAEGDIYADMASKIYKFEVSKDTHPTERFVGKTAVLGLGYGMSAAKFRITLAVGAMGPRVDLSEEEAKNVVNTYRESNKCIVNLWRQLDNSLTHMDEHKRAVTIRDTIIVEEGALLLPNGLRLRYPNLRKITYNDIENNKQGLSRSDVGWWYGDGKRIYGGKLTENVTQALARIVVCDQMLAIDEMLQEIGGQVVLTVHDEVVAVCPEDHAEQMYEHALTVMRTPPNWAPDLPLDAEGGFAKEYSK
mgnify:CR=1 FL=1